MDNFKSVNIILTISKWLFMLAFVYSVIFVIYNFSVFNVVICLGVFYYSMRCYDLKISYNKQLGIDVEDALKKSLYQHMNRTNRRIYERFLKKNK